jgi:vitellogenic carboxypeptidase-like protein
VDNPVGTGYSIAENEQDVPRDQYTVASHLYYGLQFFFSENPSFKKRPLVLAGESYAGKYVPSLAFYMLSKASSKDDEQLQFSGMAIGNGLTDPRIQVQEHANVAHYLGLIDKQQSFEVQEMACEVVDHIDKAEWLKAHETRSELCNWITRVSGIATLLDIRRSAKYHCREDGFEYLAPFLNSASTRAALHVDPYAPGWVSCRSSIRTLLAPGCFIPYFLIRSLSWFCHLE